MAKRRIGYDRGFFPGGLVGKDFIFNGCRYFCLCGFSKDSR